MARLTALRTAFLVLALLAASGARGEVAHLDEDGFVVTHVATTPAAADTVFRTMVDDIARWWDGNHSWSGDASNLYIEARLGGCLCERLAAGGFAEHLRVIYLAPGREIRLHGGLGPLQPMGAVGVMSWKVNPGDGANVIEWRYAVHGSVAGGFDAIAPAVDRVIGEQLGHLVALLETSR